MAKQTKNKWTNAQISTYISFQIAQLEAFKLKIFSQEIIKIQLTGRKGSNIGFNRNLK